MNDFLLSMKYRNHLFMLALIRVLKCLLLWDLSLSIKAVDLHSLWPRNEKIDGGHHGYTGPGLAWMSC